MTYPSGPPQLWQSNARQADVERQLQQQTQLNADPSYRAQYLRTGVLPGIEEPGSVDPSVMASVRAYGAPPSDLGSGSFTPGTNRLIQQQQASTQQATALQQRLAQQLRGLGYTSYGE